MMIERDGGARGSRRRMGQRLRRAATTIGIAAALTAGGAGDAAAQGVEQATTIGGLIDALFHPPRPFNPNLDPLVSEADYERRQADSREGIAIGVGNALSAFPLGASSAGFTYLLNPTTGERQLKAVSFGPLFVERALTNGKGVLNMGFGYQFASFDTLQGVVVDDEDAGFPIMSQIGTYADGSPVGDQWRTLIDTDSKVFLFAGSYGITNSFDVGWSVPVVSLSMRGREMRDYNGGYDWDNNLPGVRAAYPDKVGTLTNHDKTITATGIGDIVLRGKYGFGPSEAQRMLVAADLRLPTGDEENLLGSGTASLRMILGSSVRIGESASFNANGGYTVGGLTDEINFSVGSEVAVLPSKQLTLTFDFIGQNLRDTVTTVQQMRSFDATLPAPGTPPVPGVLPRRVVVDYGYWDRGATTLLRAAVGGKLSLGGNWLLTGSALFRLNDNGFQAKVVPFIGLEHTWTGQ